MCVSECMRTRPRETVEESVFTQAPPYPAAVLAHAKGKMDLSEDHCGRPVDPHADAEHEQKGE